MSGDATERPRRVVLSAAEQAGLERFLEAFVARHEEIDAATLAAASKIPALASLVDERSEEERALEAGRSRARLEAAIRDGEWASYLEHTGHEGMIYARRGIPFASWIELVGAYREAMEGAIEAHFSREADVRLEARHGLDRLMDLVLGALGDAYLAAKEQIIVQQQAAIRELSTPVLQLRDRLLLLPLIGVIDTHRARQLTEEMLVEIRDRRARVVVMDITGVPMVDSKVASHLVQSVAAARLMGASVIVTGISPGIARTLVTLGAELGEVTTLAELESGIVEAERRLGLKVVAASGAAEP